jgi:hypothetical protein
MFDTLRKRSTGQSAGCWRHSSIVGATSCGQCGARCCEHCALEVPRGELCIECALVLAGVRTRRVRREAVPEPAPLATMSWDQSAGLIDLAPARRRGRPQPDGLPELSFFRRVA